jgi:hypothetical protein
MHHWWEHPGFDPPPSPACPPPSPFLCSGSLAAGSPGLWTCPLSPSYLCILLTVLCPECHFQSTLVLWTKWLSPTTQNGCSSPSSQGRCGHPCPASPWPLKMGHTLLHVCPPLLAHHCSKALDDRVHWEAELPSLLRLGAPINCL